jgi:ketosteroid isomerase-like protein
MPAFTRTIILSLTALALGISGPAQADDASDIRALEERWGAAFLSGNVEFIAGILMPEFKLLRAVDGKVQFFPRGPWLTALGKTTFHKFDMRVMDVTLARDTAVVTLEGTTRITFAGRGTREESIALSDTWVKHNGRWQVVFRHSTAFGTRMMPEPTSK